MDSIQYIGEHLVPGYIGRFFSILSFVASSLATISYYKAHRANDSDNKTSWLRFARYAFLAETIAIVAIFVTLYYIVINHQNEYFYAWNHASRHLPIKYILSCFWEGSEGSFLLWSFWHCVLGWVLIWRGKTYEAGTLTVISFAQVFLSLMVLGVYIFDIKIGSSPFALWRQIQPDMPIFSSPNYLQIPRLYEGNGLNILLQNYWMVIHPPMLFLGFASCIVPFAFAYTGLTTQKHNWTVAVLPWTIFASATLGLGVMMGAAWAYESLSFGGYWAWDPVENASLVPFLTIVAGLHTNLIYNHTKYSLRSTYFLYIISFVLVIYSTFLTRSGVLGDTSVHAFADLGMNTLLYLFLAVWIWLMPFVSAQRLRTKYLIAVVFVITTIVSYYNPFVSLISLVGACIWLIALLQQSFIPAPQKEENTHSREFWMFIGSVVLLLSALVIICKTSLPVYNKLFGTNIAPPAEPEYAYNQVQIFVAIIISTLIGLTVFLKYGQTPQGFFKKQLLAPLYISLFVGVCITFLGKINYIQYGIGFLVAINIAVTGAVFAIIGNYIWMGLKRNFKISGSAVAHIGFGLLLLGILISSSKKTLLSHNAIGISVFGVNSKENPAENLTLFKGIPTDMEEYIVTYVDDSISQDGGQYYKINFTNKNSGRHFQLYPQVMKNNKGMEGSASNPDSRHFWYQDIFVYITAYQNGDANKDSTTQFHTVDLSLHQSIQWRGWQIILDSVTIKKEQVLQEKDSSELLTFCISMKDARNVMYQARPRIAVAARTADFVIIPDTLANNTIITFNSLLDNNLHSMGIGIKENAISQLVTLKVYSFPMINLLWLGMVVMTIGSAMSIVQRVKKTKV